MADRVLRLPDPRVLATLAGVALCVGALMPKDLVPVPVSGPTLHIVAFAIVASIWQSAGWMPRQLAARALLCLGAAIGIEAMQALSGTDRHPSPFDALASMLGATAGLCTAGCRTRRDWLVGALALLALAPPAGQALTALRPALVESALQQAWADSRREHRPRAPWPAAPARVAFTLKLPNRPDPVVVVDANSRAALAMAPGVSAQGVRPGEPGLVLVEGHRNAVFAALDGLQPGQSVYAEGVGGPSFEYEVTRREVVRWDDSGLRNEAGRGELALATCWPVGGRVSTPLRLVVRARLVQVL